MTDNSKVVAASYPEWFTDEFFLNLIQKYKNDDTITVSKVDISAPSSTDEHYGSTIYRVSINYTIGKDDDNSIALIVKVLPNNSLVPEIPAFQTEIEMYSKIIPQAERRLQEVGINFRVGPEMVYQSLFPNKVIAFTDITKQGFVMKKEPLTYKNAEQTIKKLGQWHAATFLIIRENPGMVHLYSKGCFGYDIVLDSFINQIKTIADSVAEWPGYEKYENVIRQYNKHYKEKVRSLYGPTTSNFNVLVHGDFHMKNLMHIINKGEVQDTAFLDFQLSFVGSPAVDLIYLLYVVLDDESRDKYRDEIIAQYYEHFSGTLKALGIMGYIPSLLDLQLEMVRCGPLEAFMVLAFAGFFRIDYADYDMAKLGDPTGETIVRKKIINSPLYKKILLTNIPTYVHKGYIS